MVGWVALDDSRLATTTKGAVGVQKRRRGYSGWFLGTKPPMAVPICIGQARNVLVIFSLQRPKHLAANTLIH
jgi:hypothetical protein